MLSGLQDEVVPKEQMKGLWEIVKKRRKGASATSGKINDTLHEDGESKTEEVTDGIGKSRFVEFENGTHNDTCVQPGYWHAVAEFIASLGASVT